jgi:hypothetical protein
MSACLPAVHYHPSMRYRCAWCGEILSPGPPGAPTSDGICVPCARRYRSPRLHALMDEVDSLLVAGSSSPSRQQQLLVLRLCLEDLATRGVEVGERCAEMARGRWL